jgi:hypothetical protein
MNIHVESAKASKQRPRVRRLRQSCSTPSKLPEIGNVERRAVCGQ